MPKKKALGQGLEALLGGDIDLSVSTPTKNGGVGITKLLVDSLMPNPNQPRQKFTPEALSELAESIKQQGILQPILAEKRTDGSYMIIAGERRWRASREAGLTEVPVMVRAFSQEKKFEIALVENVQRENLTPMEEARAYYHLMDNLGLSQQEVAEKVGKKRSTIANSLRLLQLTGAMKDAVEEGKVSAGHARALLSVTNPADQELLLTKVLAQSMSVRDAEITAIEMNRGHKSLVKRSNETKSLEKDPELTRLEERFIEVFGAKVSFKGTLAKGRMEISWYSRDDLDRIYEKLTQDE